MKGHTFFYIYIRKNTGFSCEIEDFVETHLCNLCVFSWCAFSRLKALIREEEEAAEEAKGEGDEASVPEKNKHMPCLLAACASGVPRVVTTALDAIVKVRVRVRIWIRIRIWIRG